MRPLLLFSFLLLNAAFLTAQTCLSGGITFTSQAEIDNFAANYPGCSEIIGNVTIGGYLGPSITTDINNLDGLAQITSIGGDLRITFNDNLVDINGLAQLTSVGGTLRIQETNALTDLSSLNNLTSISGGLEIAYNDAISSLTGLENLSSVGKLQLQNLPALTDISALAGLSATGGALEVDNNDALTDLTGLHNITSVGAQLVVRENDMLSSMSPLSNITTVGGYLSISQNDALTNLQGLQNITAIQASISINKNPVLTNINGIGNIDPATITNLFIRDNTNLSICDVQNICDYLADANNPAIISGNAGGCASRTEIETACSTSTPTCPSGDIRFSTQAEIDDFAATYPGCTEIPGRVYISESVSGNIVSLAGLAQITAIGGDLIIFNNAALSSLSGLNNLTTVGGELDLSNNPALANLNGLNSLTTISENLEIYEMDGLLNLNGLDNLTTIGGYLKVNYNDLLTSLSALANVTHIGGYVDIYENDALQNIGGLNKLTAVNGYLWVAHNPALERLSSFDQVTSIDGFLEIYNNSSLKSLDGLGKLKSVAGNVTVSRSPALKSLSGLENLTSVAGNLEIADNTSLNSLSHLANLQSIVGSLNISYNSSLKSLRGLDNIHSSTISRIYIAHSENLSFCSVESICDYPASAGPKVITDNACGCNSAEEVEKVCADTNGLLSDNDGDTVSNLCDPDDDNDTILDQEDNCPFTANADQLDTDCDGLGDACDTALDICAAVECLTAYVDSRPWPSQLKNQVINFIQKAQTLFLAEKITPAVSQLNLLLHLWDNPVASSLLTPEELYYLKARAQAMVTALKIGTAGCGNPISRRGAPAAVVIPPIVQEVQLEVFPNPARALLGIRLTRMVEGAVLSISNQLGRELVRKSLASGHSTLYLDVRDGRFEAGVHFVTILYDGGRLTERVIIIK